jgi:hypothetical protein
VGGSLGLWGGYRLGLGLSKAMTYGLHMS